MKPTELEAAPIVVECLAAAFRGHFSEDFQKIAGRAICVITLVAFCALANEKSAIVNLFATGEHGESEERRERGAR